jgi:hypothetical protein
VDNRSDIRPSLADAAVCLLILALGALQFFLYPRASDFLGDTTYYELAQSLREKGWYGYNSRPETMLPPGFAIMLAGLCSFLGNDYTILIRSMAVCATLFLLATYALLRREVGRGPAAVICLLIGSSPFLFQFSTFLLFSDLPYAFTSILALLVVIWLEAAANRRMRAALWLLFGFLLVCSLLLRSAGIAMLAALVTWLALSAVTRHPNWKARLKGLLPLLVLGIAIQGGWMLWAAKNQQPLWPLGGYPGSYVSQLKLKNGNYPELGQATLKDLPARAADNVATRTTGLLGMLLRLPEWRLEPVWYSPVVVAAVALLLLGLRYSSWSGASGLVQWYFVFYEGMYLLWPWNLEMRFVLPVAPLACLYIWRGGHALVDLLRRAPEKTGACIAVFSTILAVYPVYLAIVHQQGKKAAVVWVSLALGSICLTWIKAAYVRMTSLLSRTRVLRAAAVSVVAGLVLIGVSAQARFGLRNLHFDLKNDPFYSDITAAQWLKSHIDPDAVVMARKEDLVYHYSGRKVIWFPPASNPTLLMDGILKHRIGWIVVVDREDSYFLPADDDCFASLAQVYGNAFHLAHSGPRYRIYQVMPGAVQQASRVASAQDAN